MGDHKGENPGYEWVGLLVFLRVKSDEFEDESLEDIEEWLLN